MGRYVVDVSVVLHLVAEGIEVAPGHTLLAPTLLRSQVLSTLHTAVQRGELAEDAALERLARVQALPIRLLGDRVLQRTAWRIASELGWADTFRAEYLALTRLQADALVTLDGELARAAEGLVARAPVGVLLTTP